MSDKPIAILVVEDDPLESGWIESGLAGPRDPGADGRALRVVRAGSLAGAAERLASGGIDAVLMDLHLSDGTGLASVSWVREGAPDVPIVVVTSCEDEAVAVEALRHGADDFLVKSDVGVRRLARLLRWTIERIRWERKARAGEASLRGIVKNSPDGMVVADASGVVRFVNPAGEALLGQPARRIVGTCFDWPLVVGEPVELDIDHGSGRRFAEMRVVRTTWAGEPAYLASLRDVTAKRAPEDQACRWRKREAVGGLAGGIAHDFNNLVTAIKGYADLALQSLAADHPARRDVEAIARTGRRAAELARRLLALARREPTAAKAHDLGDALGEPSFGPAERGQAGEAVVE